MEDLNAVETVYLPYVSLPLFVWAAFQPWESIPSIINGSLPDLSRSDRVHNTPDLYAQWLEYKGSY